MSAVFRKLSGAALLVCAVLTILAAPALGEHGLPALNPLELRELLLAESFDEVERRLVSYQRDFENGDGGEYVASAGYYAFATSDPRIAGPLDAWIEAMPDSWAALTARGLYRQRIGWLMRGEHLASHTSEKRFSGMREFFALAERDLRAALKLNPHITPAHASLIGMAMANGRRSQIEDLLAAGLEVEPASYNIRIAYFDALTPKWGGSEATLAEFVRASMKWLDKNPHLRTLETKYRMRGVEQLTHQNQLRDALALSKKLLGETQNATQLLKRGGIHLRLRDYDRALADMNKALEYAPYWSGVLTSRARVLARLNRNDEALRDHDLSLRLDPLNPALLRARAYEYETQGRFREAIKDMDDALVYGWDDALIWERRASIKADGLRNNAAAIPDFEKALELNPEILRTWRLYGYSLAALKQCKAIDVFKFYHQTCESDKTCDDRYYGSIEQKTSRLIEEAGCKPADG